MSIDTLTCDEFSKLDATTHRVALAQYEQTVDKTLHELTLLPGGPARTQELDRLTSLLSLRKVHQVRLEELEGEATALDNQIFNPELDQLPS